MVSGPTTPNELVIQEVEEETLLGRNRLLKLLGSAFFGLVTARLVRSAPALATHNTPPGPCFGFPRCHHCDGAVCNQYCHWHSGNFTLGCPGGGQCWLGCADGKLYRCCDWHEVFPGQSQHSCLCRSSWLGYYCS